MCFLTYVFSYFSTCGEVSGIVLCQRIGCFLQEHWPGPALIILDSAELVNQASSPDVTRRSFSWNSLKISSSAPPISEGVYKGVYTWRPWVGSTCVSKRLPSWHQYQAQEYSTPGFASSPSSSSFLLCWLITPIKTHGKRHRWDIDENLPIYFTLRSSSTGNFHLLLLAFSRLNRTYRSMLKIIIKENGSLRHTNSHTLIHPTKNGAESFYHTHTQGENCVHCSRSTTCCLQHLTQPKQPHPLLNFMGFLL